MTHYKHHILAAKIITDKVSKRSKGFGFVTFASEDEAQKALAEMDRKVSNTQRSLAVDVE